MDLEEFEKIIQQQLKDLLEHRNQTANDNYDIPDIPTKYVTDPLSQQDNNSPSQKE